MSEYGQSLQQQSSQVNDNKCEKQVTKCFNMTSPQFYYNQIKTILQSSIDKQFLKKLLLIDNNDKEILNHLYIKQQKYRQFIKDMEVDNKYHNIIADKVNKFHLINQTKRQKHLAIQHKKQLQDEKLKLKKYFIEKNNARQKAIDALQKKSTNLAVDRDITSYKQKQHQIQKNQQKIKNKIDSIKNKQNNQIMELKEILQSLKKQNKINQIDQNKQLKQYRQQLHKLKRQIEIKQQVAKAKKKPQFKL